MSVNGDVRFKMSPIQFFEHGFGTPPAGSTSDSSLLATVIRRLSGQVSVNGCQVGDHTLLSVRNGSKEAYMVVPAECFEEMNGPKQPSAAARALSADLAETEGWSFEGIVRVKLPNQRGLRSLEVDLGPHFGRRKCCLQDRGLEAALCVETPEEEDQPAQRMVVVLLPSFEVPKGALAQEALKVGPQVLQQRLSSAEPRTK